MSEPRKKRIYWDSSCFICFLNSDEAERGYICEDILNDANAGKVELWISTWVIVEVIRPKQPGDAPLPEWAKKAIKAVPEVLLPLEELWKRYQRNNPSQKLTDEQVQMISSFFESPFIKKAEVGLIVANRAVELSRTYGLKPADSVHAATALEWKCDVIQRWDRDYSKVAALIPSEEPTRISPQASMIPEMLRATRESTNERTEKTIPASAEVSGSGNGPTEDQAGTEGKVET